MNATTASIKSIEEQIEKALWELEVHEKLQQALDIYLDSEILLNSLIIQENSPEYAEQQRVLSYCLMRQGNILRQLGKPEQAMALSEREIIAARASGDEITLARALMSNGTNQLVAGEIDKGLVMMDEARLLFEKGDTSDHQQGLGWYWILQADLANAGLVKKNPAEIIEITSHALEILEPIENWPGVARAYAARAIAYEKLGEHDLAVADREEQNKAEKKIVLGGRNPE
jgi:tetratricopeptide (TPR) repeat protein